MGEMKSETQTILDSDDFSYQILLARHKHTVWAGLVMKEEWLKIGMSGENIWFDLADPMSRESPQVSQERRNGQPT